MPFIPKLRIALSAAFIQTTAGAIGVTAQTQAVADNTSTETVAKAPSTGG